MQLTASSHGPHPKHHTRLWGRALPGWKSTARQTDCEARKEGGRKGRQAGLVTIPTTEYVPGLLYHFIFKIHLIDPVWEMRKQAQEGRCYCAKVTKQRSCSPGFDPTCLMSNSSYCAYSKEEKLGTHFLLFILPSCLFLPSREIRRGVKSYWALLGADPGQGN